MARMKRPYHYDRRRNRSRRPPPKDGFLIAELVQLSSVAAVTIKAYIRRGLLGRVKFYGASTRYPREHLVRLLVIRCCRAQGMRQLDEIRRKLDAWAPADMERWVLEHPLAPETLAALGYPQGASQSLQTPTAATAALSQEPVPAGTTPPSVLPTETWRRVMLMPGLELQLKLDAGPIVQSVAERLIASFAQLLTART